MMIYPRAPGARVSDLDAHMIKAVTCGYAHGTNRLMSGH